MTDKQLREAVARLYEDKWGVRDFGLADAAIALMRPVMRAQALKEAARVAAIQSVAPGYTTNEHMMAHRIAAAILALIDKE